MNQSCICSPNKEDKVSFEAGFNWNQDLSGIIYQNPLLIGALWTEKNDSHFQNDETFPVEAGLNFNIIPDMNNS